jgi:nucleotide-binding universal stress UspA family protein
MNASFPQVLVHFDNTARSSVRLAAARRLSSKDPQSAISVLHAVTPSYLSIPYSGDVGAGALQALQDLDNDRLAEARLRFDQELRRPGPQALWASTAEIAPAAGFARQALFADLVVLGQHDAADALARDVPADFVESVLIASATPALIIPYTGAVPQAFRTVLVAWKETPEAARAVRAALPWLQAARDVVVVGPRAQAHPEIRGPHLDLEVFLRGHGVRARFQSLDEEKPAEAGELLLSRAADVSADLLVMGCYGHSRMREWALGGATRAVLASMTLPVLMAH